MSTSFETDVIIVGGGPSGTSTALSLLQFSDLKVVILEQTDLNFLRVGEQVNASIFDLLDYLNISKNDFTENCFLPGYDSLAVWGTSNISSRHSIFNTQIDSYQLDRESFDLLLLQKAAERGAIILPRIKIIEFKQDDCNHWLFRVMHQTKKDILIKAKYLVDASGRQSIVSRKIGATILKFDELIAIGSFFHYKNDEQIKQEVLLETAEYGWWYLATLPNNQIVCSLFTDATIAKELQLQKSKNWSSVLSDTRFIKKKLTSSYVNQNIWTRNAFSHIVNADNINNFLAVGDACASFDPISSMGIGFAISSACHAGKAIIDNEFNSNSVLEYKKSISTIFSNYLTLKTQYYRKEQRWKESPFWMKRIS